MRPATTTLPFPVRRRSGRDCRRHGRPRLQIREMGFGAPTGAAQSRCHHVLPHRYARNEPDDYVGPRRHYQLCSLGNRAMSRPMPPAKPSNIFSAAGPGSGQVGLVAAVSIGIGGMVGAGIFSILGVVAHAAGNAMWLAFAIGGVVALLSTYSYAKLGATFPSAGGATHFLVKSFGDGVLAGGLNLFMWAGYIISLALYATAFGGYAATFVTTAPSALLLKSLAVASVVLLTLVNAFGATFMGRWETVIVAVKVAILVLFAAVGLCFIRPGYLSPELWPETKSVLFGAGVLFIGYEGFGLITNAAADM